MSFIRKRKRLIASVFFYLLGTGMAGFSVYASFATGGQGSINEAFNIITYMVISYVSILLGQAFQFSEVWKIGSIIDKLEGLEPVPISTEDRPVSDEKPLAALLSRGVEDIKKYRPWIPFGFLCLAVYFSPLQLYERLVMAAILAQVLNWTQEASQ